MRAISYGGGVQSTALVVLAATGQLGADVALFANVGEDSENPHTLTYVREVAIPWAAARGLPIHILEKTLRDGSTQTIAQKVLKPDTKSDVIPFRLNNGMPGGRACTADFKVAVITKWLKAHGASPENPATRLVGISTDEIERANPRKAGPGEILEYPLLDPFRLNRDDCKRLIARAGLPVPPKSACFFCPLRSQRGWREMRRDQPDLFWMAVDFERSVTAKRAAQGRGPAFLHVKRKPLDEAVVEAQPVIPGFESYISEGCDSGVCWV